MDDLRLLRRYPWMERPGYIRDMLSHDFKHKRLTSGFTQVCNRIKATNLKHQKRVK